MGLYYPYVHFRSDAWLKLAALYWPKMSRMVPADYPVRDSETVRILAGELGFVLDLDPSPAVQAIAPIFHRVVADNLEPLQLRYGLSLWEPKRSFDPTLIGAQWHTGGFYIRDTWRDQSGIPFINEVRSPYEPGVANKPAGIERGTLPVTGLCIDQVEPRLRRTLIDTGLARERDDLRPWLVVDPEFAWVYSCALSDKLAADNLLSPTTDQTSAHSFPSPWSADSAAAALLKESLPQLIQDPASAIGLLAVQLVVPTDLDAIPAKKIVEIRKRYAEDFDAFGEAVAAIASDIGEELAGISEPGVLNAYIEQIVARNFTRRLQQLHRDLTEVNINNTFTAASMKFNLPATAVAAGAGLLAHEPLVTGASAVAFGLLSLRHGLRQDRKNKLVPTPSSYLLRVENGLTSRTLADRITQVLTQIIGLHA